MVTQRRRQTGGTDLKELVGHMPGEKGRGEEGCDRRGYCGGGGLCVCVCGGVVVTAPDVYH